MRSRNLAEPPGAGTALALGVSAGGKLGPKSPSRGATCHWDGGRTSHSLWHHARQRWPWSTDKQGDEGLRGAWRGRRGRVLSGRGDRTAERRPQAPGRAPCAAQDSVETMQGTPKARPHRALPPRSAPPDWGPALRGPRGSRGPSVFGHMGPMLGDTGRGAAGLEGESGGVTGQKGPSDGT